MRIPPCYRVLTLLLSSIVFGGVLGAQSPVGVFATHTEVGRASGSASYDPQRQTYLVAGSGQNMWGSRDDFHFVWKRISGNFVLSTRARFIGAGVEEHRKIGWTIRPSLDPGSAHNDTVTERATFSNVRITMPAKRDFVPYRDYIGSNLEMLDVATGNATIVHQYSGSFQAPNWTRDGKALIYVQEGRLYRFDLSSRSAAAINTGFATRNNNDHVLSFDGRLMGISHHAVEDSGASIIYTVPPLGGTPTRVTAKGPSYLHGWSPDGRWLVYTGQRNGELDVYKIPVAGGGGDEIRLTTAPGLDDGPEFTPDGAYIYFNSSRSGRMQIWRMRPDGTAQEQVTNDGLNNWFPHISPDGKWIVYLAFPPDVAPDDHPFYKHVLLRLMPIGGGPARVIAYLYGGQGTINVPSWAPDGSRLAFVSNSVMP